MLCCVQCISVFVSVGAVGTNPWTRLSRAIQRATNVSSHLTLPLHSQSAIAQPSLDFMNTSTHIHSTWLLNMIWLLNTQAVTYTAHGCYIHIHSTQHTLKVLDL